MAADLDLKQIERRAFRSTYQDGLWEMYLAAVVAAMGFFLARPEDGYAPFNVLIAVLILSLEYSLYKAGKKYITLPRLGQVSFGPTRMRRKRTLAYILAAVVFVQTGLVALTIFAWRIPELGRQITALLGDYSTERMAVAALASLFVGPSLLVISFFNDYGRGYITAGLVALAVFLMIYFNQPVYPLAIGVLIFLPGLVTFIRFLRKYPVPHYE